MKLGTLEAVPPALRYRLRDALQLLPTDGGALDGLAAERLDRVISDGEGWLGSDPALADVGYWMIDSKHSVEMRRQGCIWLTRFPSVETAKRLSRVLADPTTPEPVREQATWTLGYRQLRGMHPSTQWSTDAVQIADEALAKLADAATTAGKVASEQLPHALRHFPYDKVEGVWLEWLRRETNPAVLEQMFDVIRHQLADARHPAGPEVVTLAIAHLKLQPQVLARQSVIHIIGGAVPSSTTAKDALMAQAPIEFRNDSGLYSQIAHYLPNDDVLRALAAMPEFAHQFGGAGQ